MVNGSMEFLSESGKRVTDDMNVQLACDFIAEAIQVALKQKHPSNASRPDGMPTIFCERHWHIVGLSVTKVVLQALNLGQIPTT